MDLPELPPSPHPLLAPPVSWWRFTRGRTVALIGIIFVVGSIWWFAMIPPSSFPTPAIITVPEGASLRGVGRLLRADNIVRSSALFEFYITLLGGERQIKAGQYIFERPAPPFRIASRIIHGAYGFRKIAVTIPEGSTRAQIVEFLQNKQAFSLFNPDEFLAITADKEGYLFPDTYFLKENIRAAELADLLEQTFEKKIAPYAGTIASSGHTEQEIITMASLIEAEARTPEDRRIVAGILWHRLALKMPLQVDVARVTYEYRGLPAHPINNPGLQSIDAALHPANTSYLYYLSDTKGTIHYAATFAQHKTNIVRYLSSS